ncbi:Pollen receptor-like kinase 1 [Camellia lanceoleosa]|uniref:Pollen receptor-like kinase 1 n=1 Tax=Camellia lanceoleosa TaxID=1840588 RepID=A0ACC0H7I1_9ERIC|nr:Pollen receptor-like kinase 1 [Camellia lanceoleosa]
MPSNFSKKVKKRRSLNLISWIYKPNSAAAANKSYTGTLETLTETPARHSSSMTPQLGSSSSFKATGLPVPAAVVVAEQQQYGSSPDMSVSSNSKRGDQHGKLSFVRDDRQRFDLQDLLRASAEVLGSDNFGSSYKAVLMDGHAVVVKRKLQRLKSELEA